MRKIFILFICLFLVSFSFANDVILGIALSFEGIDSEFSWDQLNAIKLANNGFPSYKGYVIKLSVSDITKNVRKSTLNLIDKKAVAIIGYPSSSEALKIVDLAERIKIPILLTTATNSILISGRQYVTMTMSPDSEEAKVLSDFIIKKFKHPKIAFIYDEEHIYCKSIVSKIYSYLRNNSVSFLQKNYIFSSKTSYDTNKIVESLRNYNPDLLFFSSHPEFSYTLLNSLLKNKVGGVFLFSSAFDDNDFYKAFYDAKNFYVCGLNINKNQSFYKKVSSDFEKKYSKHLDLYSLMAYNSYLIFYNALKQCVDSGKEVNRKNLNFFIRNTKNIELLGGSFKFTIKTGGTCP